MDIIVLANKDINSIRSPILKGAIAAMIRADKKAKALQKKLWQRWQLKISNDALNKRDSI